MARKHVVLATIVAIVPIAILIFGFIFTAVYFNGRIHPGTRALKIDLGGKSIDEAVAILSEKVPTPESVDLVVVHNNNSWEFEIPLESFSAGIDYLVTAQNAYHSGKGVGVVADTTHALIGFTRKQEIPLEVHYDKNLLEEQLLAVFSQLPQQPEEPRLFVVNGRLEVDQGASGPIISLEVFEQKIIESLGKASSAASVQLVDYNPALNETEREVFVKRGERLINKILLLTTDEQTFKYEGQNLIDLLAPRGGFREDLMSPGLEEIKDALDSEPQNPVFVFEEGKVKEFLPAKEGVEVNTSDLSVAIASAITEMEASDINEIEVKIPLGKTQPDFRTEDVNDLGIKEVVGVGRSRFAGSIPSRVHNVALAASRLNGALIAPGEVFSFNQALGDISAYSGYKQAYVIRGNQTVLGDGGGVCQVSTTFFRAALDAGLPIVEWKPHSYRVGYYEQGSPAGLDATIYSPSVDLKVRNDTPGHILVQTATDTKNMTLKIEFYGTHDGRVVEMTTPVITNVTPPPEDLYIDDPNLPAGAINQIDYSAWGARASFDYLVTRDGETIYERSFISNYRPWQAKFLRGVGPTN